jgi:hypothetical protein
VYCVLLQLLLGVMKVNRLSCIVLLQLLLYCLQNKHVIKITLIMDCVSNLTS